MAERERRSGAGAHLAGVLERSTPPRPTPAADPELSDTSQVDEAPDPEPTAGRGRGATSRKTAAARGAEARAARKIKGRTIYLPDDLFERILVQAHRRNRTISEYVAAILDRQVPDHRVVRAETSGENDAA
jgi:hypothetical protein